MKQFMKDILLTSGIIVIILESKTNTTQKKIDDGIFINVGITALSIIFYDFFQKIGINVYLKAETTYDVVRYAGISHLDLNQFAAQMLLIFGYFLSRIEKQTKLKYYIGCGFSLVGIFGSGSRFAFLVLIFISAVFFLRNMRTRFFNVIIPSIVLFTLLPLFINIVALERTAKYRQINDQYEFSQGRKERQIAAIKYIFNKPSILLTGSQERFTAATCQTRHIHNSYIALLFKYGIVPFMIYLILILKMVRLEKSRRRVSYSLIYPLMAFFLPQISVDYRLFMYFPIIVAMSASDNTFDSKIHRLPERSNTFQ